MAGGKLGPDKLTLPSGSSDPSSGIDNGDVFYNTTTGPKVRHGGSWVKLANVNDGSSVSAAAETTQELRNAGVSTDGMYYMKLNGSDVVRVYVDFSRRASKDWILVLHYPSGGLGRSDQGGGGTARMDRPMRSSSSGSTTLNVYSESTAGAGSNAEGPDLNYYGNLNMRSAYIPTSAMPYIMTESIYSGTTYYQAYPSGSQNFQSNNTGFTTVTPIAYSNSYDSTIRWHSELNGLNSWRSSHFACGNSISSPNGSYGGFGTCRTGASDSGSNNSGTINGMSLWENTVYINSYPHGSGTEYGTNFKIWIATN